MLERGLVEVKGEVVPFLSSSCHRWFPTRPGVSLVALEVGSAVQRAFLEEIYSGSAFAVVQVQAPVRILLL